jgi:hypothetical protein
MADVCILVHSWSFMEQPPRWQAQAIVRAKQKGKHLRLHNKSPCLFVWSTFSLTIILGTRLSRHAIALLRKENHTCLSEISCLTARLH